MTGYPLVDRPNALMGIQLQYRAYSLLRLTIIRDFEHKIQGIHRYEKHEFMFNYPTDKTGFCSNQAEISRLSEKTAWY